MGTGRVRRHRTNVTREEVVKYGAISGGKYLGNWRTTNRSSGIVTPKNATVSATMS